MKLNNLLLVIFFLCAFIANGQADYFVRDTTLKMGVTLIDGGEIANSEFCQLKNGNEITKYSPHEVKEYGFKDGRVYVSKEIQVAGIAKRVFLNQLVKGKIILYLYKGQDLQTFYLEKDSSTLIDLPKKNITRNDYNNKLTNLTSDCPKVLDASKVVGYTKKSLSKFISRYNACELKPFPYLRYGLFFGAIQSKPILKSGSKDDRLKTVAFQSDTNPYYGLFIDSPITSEFSILSSVGFYQSSYSTSFNMDGDDYDIVINQSTLKIPVSIKYTLPTLTYRPYLFTGITYSNNIKNNNTVYQATLNNNIIQYSTPDTDEIISKHQLGYSCGVGIQYHQNYKRVIFAEIQFNKDFSIGSKELLDRSSITLLCGVNF